MLPDHPYWTKVRLRFDNMVSDVYQSTRVANENGRTIVNCWLPPMAAHNLVAASELVLASTAAGSTRADITEARIPQTVDALLRTRRSIEVTSRPDLVNFLSDLETEIRDDYPTLPFEFEIRLAGPDLLKEGITQNQRLGDIRMDGVPLSEILTEIMMQANPDKNATSPRDPRCKLVWALAPDPDQPDRRTVLVTTRSAASERGYSLPAAFQSE